MPIAARRRRVALPISIGTALFIAEVAPPRLRVTLVALVDLMAAVPSVVYGLWGLFLLQGQVIGLSRWLSTWFGWIPFFDVAGADPNSPLASATVYTASTFIAGIVVALMVMPIQCSIMREVFSQVPIGEREGAFALGATRWGMIRIVVPALRAGRDHRRHDAGPRPGARRDDRRLLIISPRFDINFHVLEAGSNSVSSLIALRYSEASGFGLSALMAAGLALFALTLVVNFTASSFVARSRSGREQRSMTVTMLRASRLERPRRRADDRPARRGTLPTARRRRRPTPAPALERRTRATTADRSSAPASARCATACCCSVGSRRCPGALGFVVVGVRGLPRHLRPAGVADRRPAGRRRQGDGGAAASAAVVAGAALFSVVLFTLWRGRDGAAATRTSTTRT